jgi:hypothetical protein
MNSAVTPESFDPNEYRHLPCIVCGSQGVMRANVAVAMFYPTTDATRAAVLALRKLPVGAGIQPGLVYATCMEHLGRVDLVEKAILDFAKKVVAQ